MVVSYVVLDKKRLADSINVSEEDINNEYQFRIEQLKKQAGNNPHVSAIVIQSGDERTEAGSKGSGGRGD